MTDNQATLVTALLFVLLGRMEQLLSLVMARIQREMCTYFTQLYLRNE